MEQKRLRTTDLVVFLIYLHLSFPTVSMFRTLYIFSNRETKNVHLCWKITNSVLTALCVCVQILANILLDFRSFYLQYLLVRWAMEEGYIINFNIMIFFSLASLKTKKFKSVVKRNIKMGFNFPMICFDVIKVMSLLLLTMNKECIIVSSPCIRVLWSTVRITDLDKLNLVKICMVVWF